MNFHCYDIETYPNVFTMAVKRVSDGQEWQFEISDWRNDADLIRSFCQSLTLSDSVMVGFNNIGFDYPIIHILLTKGGTVTAQELYAKAQAIFNTGNRFEHTIYENHHKVPQIDLFKVHHFDNKSRMTSLKELEFNMRMDTIQDLPIPPGAIVQFQDIWMLHQYNMHDVRATAIFLEHSMDKIEFRRKLSDKYGRNLMNFNDTKIGKDYLIQEMEKVAPGSCYSYDGRGRTVRQTKRPPREPCIPDP